MAYVEERLSITQSIRKRTSLGHVRGCEIYERFLGQMKVCQNYTRTRSREYVPITSHKNTFATYWIGTALGDTYFNDKCQMTNDKLFCKQLFYSLQTFDKKFDSFPTGFFRGSFFWFLGFFVKFPCSPVSRIALHNRLKLWHTNPRPIYFGGIVGHYRGLNLASNPDSIFWRANCVFFAGCKRIEGQQIVNEHCEFTNCRCRVLAAPRKKYSLLSSSLIYFKLTQEVFWQENNFSGADHLVRPMHRHRPGF